MKRQKNATEMQLEVPCWYYSNNQHLISMMTFYSSDGVQLNVRCHAGQFKIHTPGDKKAAKIIAAARYKFILIFGQLVCGQTILVRF